MEASAAEAASSSADLETQLHARCHAAESRARVLHAQLAAAAEAIEALQLQSEEGAAPGLRGRVAKLVAEAAGAPGAEQLRLCTQVATAQAESQRLARELGAAAEREAAALRAAEREQERSGAVIKSGIESSARARNTMALQQDELARARSSHADALSKLEGRLAVCEADKAKAEAAAAAHQQNARRLVQLVEQHERRRHDERAAAEQADVERLNMQRALKEMAEQLDGLRARAAEEAKSQAAAEAARVTAMVGGGPKRAVLARRQARAGPSKEGARKPKASSKASKARATT